jgi:hypothetical protein
MNLSKDLVIAYPEKLEADKTVKLDDLESKIGGKPVSLLADLSFG